MMSNPRKDDRMPASGTEGPIEEFIPKAGADFVVTRHIDDITERALAYLAIGYPVHLSGPAGTGKSTLAMHIASQLGRPCTLLHGDDEFKSSDLLGRDTGYQRNSVVDNYVSSIVKTEETLSVVWTSNRLTTACQKGHTLVYDEFTRSPATANNPFLSILEEGILNIPSSGKQKGYIKVHPSFRAIFTSNPEEYVGVHKTQDALLDRMITMRIDYQDRETEAAIVKAKSERSQEDAEKIVDLIRAMRKLLGNNNGPTVRSAIAIAKIVDFRGCEVDPENPVFITTCKDVLCYHVTRQQETVHPHAVDEVIRHLGEVPVSELMENVVDTNPITIPTESVSADAELEACAEPEIGQFETEVETDGTALELEPPEQERPQRESAGQTLDAVATPASSSASDAYAVESVENAFPTGEMQDGSIPERELAGYESPERDMLATTREISESLQSHVSFPAEPATGNVADTSSAMPSTKLESVTANTGVGRDFPRPPSTTGGTASATGAVSAGGGSRVDVGSGISGPLSGGELETATPREMLEAAVSRYLRPPGVGGDDVTHPGVIG